jgi:hypothetical protein
MAISALNQLFPVPSIILPLVIIWSGCCAFVEKLKRKQQKESAADVR